MRKRLGAALITGGLIGAGTAHASCGAAFCTTTNDWLSLTQGVQPGWTVWGQLEYLNQNQLHQGSDKISPDQIPPDESHQEIKTINRNALLGAEYGFTQNWAAILILPYSNREHTHIHDPGGEAALETWQFDNLGDVRLKIRYQPSDHHANDLSWTLNAGLKLPTGKFDVQNSEGETAERSVQPGTGTTDLLLGGGIAYFPLSTPLNLFANLQLQSALNDRDGYRPGWRAGLQAGGQYPLTDRLDLLLQANLQYSARDSGVNAEPDQTGRTQLAIVPGLSYSWPNGLMIYSNLELPVYQDVNGIQLTYDYAVSLGMSFAFK
jgi:Putative MetA-pathway of phenol degradation